MAKEKNNEELLGLGEKLSEERLSQNKKRSWKKIAMIAGVLGLAAIIYFGFLSSSGGSKYEFVKVAKKDLRESVEITGNVEAGATIALSFRDSGQVEEINFDTSDKVKKGDIIASLNNRDQELRLQQAKVNLQAAQANLNERLAGSTSQEVKIAEAGVKQSEAAADKISIDWDNAKKELELIKKKYFQDEKKAQLLVDDAKTKYEFALKNQGNTSLTQDLAVETAKKDLEAQLYSTANQIQSSLINLKGVIIDDGNSLMPEDIKRLDFKIVSVARDDYYDAKKKFEPMYEQLKSASNYTPDQLEEFSVIEQQVVTNLLHGQKMALDALAVLPPSTTLSENELSQIKANLIADSSALSSSYGALNLRYQAILDAQLGLTTSGDSQTSQVSSAKNVYDQQLQTFEQTKIDHQVDLNAREANIRSLEAQYKIQLADIESAKATLDQRKVGPRAVDVAYLRAQVAASGISVALAEEALEKTLLRAPVDGILSRKNIDVGEDAVSSASLSAREEGVFEMISDQKFKIDAEIAEVDIGKIKVGTKVEIKLDAVGEEIFPGVIAKIDPVQTVIQDVVFYKAEVLIDSQDARIKPGMTADVEIVINEKKDVLTVPDKAIQNDNGKKYVRELVDKKVKNIDIETGIRDLQGNQEVKGGLKEGQEIILRTINGRN
ncbi:efflux RND transporter periplasmic adaptor subunit [Candidatus Peregrinibacteria bacterium]|nr:efflux RND transporter periplasmic adaptor subunit [Candidatus Peregrinibacteria bacterium]